MQQMTKRDIRFDIMKAVAIILVFLGHVMQFGFARYEDNPVFSCIWALQIPLFMFVSGYFSAADGALTGKKALDKIGKRAIAYLLPFVSYFYIIKVLILGYYGRNVVTATASLMYHLEDSLWFLWVVFFLSVIFILGDCFSGKAKHPVAKLALLAVSVGVLLLPWAALCVKVSTAFLGSKYVLYYTLFFGTGFLLRKYRMQAARLLRKGWIADVVFLLCLGVFGWIVLNTTLFSTQDGLRNTALRVVAGFTGIGVVGMLCRKVSANGESKLQRSLLVIGANTLEIYAMHCLAVTVLPKTDVEIFTFSGYLHLTVYAAVVATITYGLIRLLKANRLTNLLFFGRT